MFPVDQNIVNELIKIYLWLRDTAQATSVSPLLQDYSTASHLQDNDPAILM